MKRWKRMKRMNPCKWARLTGVKQFDVMAYLQDDLDSGEEPIWKVGPAFDAKRISRYSLAK